MHPGAIHLHPDGHRALRGLPIINALMFALGLSPHPRAAGLSLTGPGGLLKQLTKSMIKAALDEEMSGHLG